MFPVHTNATTTDKNLDLIIIIIKALFKTERPISEVREEDAGINRWSVSINYMIKNDKKSKHYIYDQSYLNQ